MGRVADGALQSHKHPFVPPDTIHNDAGNLAHDVYTIVPWGSPGGSWGPNDYVRVTDEITNFTG